jgi:hypothetical protein
MATRRFSSRHLFFAGAVALAVAIGPAVSAVALAGQPSTVAGPAACTNTHARGSYSLACSPGATTGISNLPSEDGLTYENMFDHPGGFGGPAAIR